MLSCLPLHTVCTQCLESQASELVQLDRTCNKQVPYALTHQFFMILWHASGAPNAHQGGAVDYGTVLLLCSLPEEQYIMPVKPALQGTGIMTGSNCVCKAGPA